MNFKLKEKLKAKEVVLGCFINYYAPSQVEMIGLAGYDFFVLDNEHGSFSPHEIENMIRAANVVGLSVIVRVDYDNSSIQKALDTGAEGIQVPKVNTRLDAETVVKRAKYPTEGDRGVGFSARSARLSREKGAAYIKKANENVLIVIQIESKEAIDNIDEILSTPGIDVAFLGKVDLSASIGLPGDVSNPAVLEMESKFYTAAKKHGIVSGLVLDKKMTFEDAYNRRTLYLADGIPDTIANIAAKVKTRDEFLAYMQNKQ
jgi:4-hydroxy-2-oxoheptanedioate aldolase